MRRPDWDALAESDAEWWTKISAAERIRIADGLRRQIQKTHPEWPTEADRQADLEHHIELSARLRGIRPTDAREDVHLLPRKQKRAVIDLG